MKRQCAGIMKQTILCVVAAILLIIYGANGFSSQGSGQKPLIIKTQSGAEHAFYIEVARTPDEQEKGLMFRKTLPADAGMLFYFGHDRFIEMWMRNTLISLDMLFISREGTIVKIAKNAVPHSLDRITSGKPIIAVLELNGGTSDRLSLTEGDKVQYAPLF